MADPTVPYHVPVLLQPVVEAAAGAGRVVDATVGGGGHSEALRAAGHQVLAIDRDPDAIAFARSRLGDAGIRYLQASYDAPEALEAVAEWRPGFILLDLGVSSHQLDATGRGFTFRPGAPLDMRMDGEGASAADLLNEADNTTLERIFAEYGDERRARRLAGEIVRRREPGRVPRQRRSGQRDPRDARTASRPFGIRPPVPGGTHRGERRALRIGPRPAGFSGCAGAGRRPGRHHLSLGRRPAGEAGLQGVGQRLRLSAAPADLHLSRAAARAGRPAQADPAVRGGNRRELARPERQTEDLSCRSCGLRGDTG